MKISVIIPTYQRTNFLRETLECIIEQDFPKDQYEVIIVDNAVEPTQELIDLANSFAYPSINYVHESKNGLHNARHAGAKAAKGEILVYIDDDVICPRGWLTAMAVPYSNQEIAMVAGKVILRYETDPPNWLFQFSGILSALDLGDTSCMVEPYISPVGCNMSVRKSVLFDLGGFNPDAFGDKSLINFRGDGECGLARKIHDTGFGMWYAPDAWLEHRVPSKRMTEKYIQWRNTIGGIEDAYADLRYHRRTMPGLLLRCGLSVLYLIYHRCQAYRHRRDVGRRIQHLAAAKRYQYRGIQRLKQIMSATLRGHTTQMSYL
ncbi:MAG: glycosyltransferase family 2 protein [Syntrophorhabdaceae bacterium]|nr:glycosyltransferase family 2 protein [Syntrophorhabdaceae bacterium]